MAVLLGCFLWLVDNYRKGFDSVEQRYTATDAFAVNLDNSLSKDRLARFLDNNNYVDNPQDADFIAGFLTAKLRGDTVPEALTDLNRRIWQLPARLIEQSGTPTYRARLDEARAQLGWNSLTERLAASDSIGSSADGGHGGNAVMTVEVYDPKPESKTGFLDRLLKHTRIPSPGVLVQLRHHHLDADSVPATVTIAYARTGSDGRAVFTGLHRDSSYSVLPVRQGYSYGAAKGTYLGTLGEHVDRGRNGLSFLSSEHRLRIFPTDKLRTIREDGLMTVRTPDSFRNTITLYFLGFLLCWLVLLAAGNMRGRQMDCKLAAFLMLLTGLGMLFMFGINDPLTERLLGVETGKGAIGGVIVMAGLMCLDITRFFQGGYRIPFDLPKVIIVSIVTLPFRVLDFIGLGRLWDSLHARLSGNPIYRTSTSRLSLLVRRTLALPGIGYLMAALLATLLVDLFGQEVGGMKVNLNLGFGPFQPSEITKYLLVIFMAAFWFDRGDAIIAYSRPAAQDGLQRTGTQFRRKLLTMAGILIGLAVLIVMYLKLSDMGPALVVSLTFIILYSMIKSRIGGQSADGQDTARQIVFSDISMMAIGVISFIVFLYIGSQMKLMLLAAALWLLLWLAAGWTFRRQVFESAIMLNLIIFLFVCGTDVLTALGKGDIAVRLDERNQMCVNTWGTPGGEPGVNTQVAEGLWGLAGGGMTGQGLGNAKAHYIPAFHTDMILQSIGELTGFLGLAGVVILLSLVLRRSLLAGYCSGHPFILYLCGGIAVVTGVQFFIIAMGSLGVIPLTGVTVPFLSYGKVSLVLNCFAFGIVLSVSARNRTASTQGTRPYNHTVAVLSLLHLALAVFVLGTVLAYQIEPVRSHTMIRPVYVYDNSGAAVIRYNPRISYLTSRMQAGNIYDRNGLLLATSSAGHLQSDKVRQQLRRAGLGDVRDMASRKAKRYYPWGSHLYFMLGNANSGLYFSSVGNAPYGYLAEARHMSELRGYDNRKLDANGQPMTVDLHSDRYKRDRFMPAGTLDTYRYQLRDYSVLLPFLKGGNTSSLLDKYNRGDDTGVSSNLGGGVDVTPKDIRLTVDARLQTGLQKRIPAYLQEPDAAARLNRHNRRFERYSIVVLDAVNGDLLASANYPLPDERRIVECGGSYTDDYRPSDWSAFTERDLGLTHATNPGSTAKIMSALAGLMHMDSIGGRVEDYRYRIYSGERIHNRGAGQEPPAGGVPSAIVDMRQAIVQSSNIYFINLVNDLDLYRELSEIYGWGGIRIAFSEPYSLQPADGAILHAYRDAILDAGAVATRRYDDYVQQRDKPGGVIRRMVGNDGRYTSDYWTWAWGEGTLDATPVAMARVAATAATGYMPETRFRGDSDPVMRRQMVSSSRNLEQLRQYMKQEAASGSRSLDNPDIGGKTGTPERIFRPLGGKKGENRNDGWYIAFIDKASIPGTGDRGKGKLAVAVRVERTMSSGSGYAKDMMRRVVLPVLRELDYIGR